VSRQLGFLRFLADGYNGKSVVAVMLVLALGGAIGFCEADLLRRNLSDINWLLIGLWAGMTALLCWKVQPARDLALAAVALAGGLAFEWWGTHTRLWCYFTGETPPAWILPAWPVAALASSRIALLLERVWSKARVNWQIPYWGAMLLFAVGMVWFIWPSLNLFLSKAACGLIVVVVVLGKRHRRDCCLFLGGACLGVLLEYWGTTRGCWTYYSGATPPLIAAAAHGFAQVCYARTLDAFAWSYAAGRRLARREKEGVNNQGTKEQRGGGEG
jgi:hypothetical protein